MEYIITTECNVSESDRETLGCIFILHKQADYTRLSVHTILKENLTLNLKVEDEGTYFYAILEWRKSGLLGSKELAKGKVTVYVKDKHNQPLRGYILGVTAGIISSLILICLLVSITIILLLCHSVDKRLSSLKYIYHI